MLDYHQSRREAWKQNQGLEMLHCPTQKQWQDKTTVSDDKFTHDSPLLFIPILINAKIAVLTLVALVQGSMVSTFNGHMLTRSEHCTVNYQ